MLGRRGARREAWPGGRDRCAPRALPSSEGCSSCSRTMRKAPWCSSQATRCASGCVWAVVAARRARTVLHASGEKCGLRLGALQGNATSLWRSFFVPQPLKKSHEFATVLALHFVLPPQCGAHFELMKWSWEQKYRGGSLCFAPHAPRERRRRHHELRTEVELRSSAGNPCRRKSWME